MKISFLFYPFIVIYNNIVVVKTFLSAYYDKETKLNAFVINPKGDFYKYVG